MNTSYRSRCCKHIPRPYKCLEVLACLCIQLMIHQEQLKVLQSFDQFFFLFHEIRILESSILLGILENRDKIFLFVFRFFSRSKRMHFTNSGFKLFFNLRFSDFKTKKNQTRNSQLGLQIQINPENHANIKKKNSHQNIWQSTLSRGADECDVSRVKFPPAKAIDVSR